jgi:hypothetical protein
MALKKVKRDKLKEAVAKHAETLPEKMVIVVGARGIKNGQVEVEFAQNRNLAGQGRINVLGLLNAGDDRFNTGKTLMRVWTMVSLLGFKNLFGDLDGIDMEEVFTECKKLGEDERIALLKPVATINVDGVQQALKIVCRETINIEDLPKSIKEQMKDGDVDDDIKQRYILQTGGDKSQKIVDEFGNTVYRTFSLEVGSVEDILVPGKQLKSDYDSKKASKSTTKDALKDIEKDLVG